MGVAALGSVILLCAATTPAANAQDAADSGVARGKILAAAREIAAAARYATLVTIAADGQPQARIVDPFAPEPDFTIWVATNRLTRKVGEIGREPRVTLLYFEPVAGEYVTVVGVATLVADPTERARRWKPEWAPFYEGGPLGDKYLLIRIRPVRMEIVSPGRGLLNDPRTWRPLQIEFP